MMYNYEIINYNRKTNGQIERKIMDTVGDSLLLNVVALSDSRLLIITASDGEDIYDRFGLVEELDALEEEDVN